MAGFLVGKETAAEGAAECGHYSDAPLAGQGWRIREPIKNLWKFRPFLHRRQAVAGTLTDLRRGIRGTGDVLAIEPSFA
jgi:hypothetical protein